MYLIVKQHIHEAGLAYQPEVVATATKLAVARRVARQAISINIIGIYEADVPCGTGTMARPVQTVLGGTTLGSPERIEWWGDEQHHA